MSLYGTELQMLRCAQHDSDGLFACHSERSGESEWVLYGTELQMLRCAQHDSDGLFACHSGRSDRPDLSFSGQALKVGATFDLGYGGTT